LLLLEDGEYWSIYGSETVERFVVAGFVQGVGVASGGSFTSTNARDFGRIPPIGGTVQATYDLAARTVSGTVNYPAGPVLFAGEAIPVSAYDYDAAASISTIAGNWTLSTLANETVAMTISPSGSVSAITTLNCSFTGSIAPRLSGKNVFDVTLTFGPAPCLIPGQTARGVGLAYLLVSGQLEFIIAGVNNERTLGALAFGTR
jgi:hypothetical protein